MPYKSALITGASKGIGRAVALELAGTDLEIITTARNERELGTLQDEIRSSGGQNVYRVADLSRKARLEEFIDFIRKDDREIDLLVHSAGIARVGKIQDLSPEDWSATLDINLTVPFLLTRKLLPLMSSGALIIFVNSVAGRTTFPEWGAYSASKYGLKGLADTLRQELQPEGIRVTTVYSSSVDTPMQDNLPYDWDRERMLSPVQIAKIIVSCYRQPDSVMIREIDVENSAGTF